MGILAKLSGADLPFIELVKSSTPRKAKAETLLLAFEDQQKEELQAQLASRWSRPEQFSLISLPLVRRVTESRVQAYREPPKRTADGFDQALLTEVYEAFGIDAALKRASRLSWLLGVTGFQLGWGEAGGWSAVIPPSLLDVIAADNNPAAPKRVIVTHLASKIEETTYSDWTPTGYTRRDYRGNPVPIPGNKTNTNPYGVIPIAICQGRWADGVFPPIPDSLLLAQGGANELLMTLWRSALLQSFGQPWATGINAGTALETGPDKAITLPDGGNFGFAQPDAPLGELVASLQFLLSQTAAANSISTDVFRLDGKAESGSAKAMERADLAEARADDLALWRAHEQKIFRIVRAVWNAHNPARTIPDEATIGLNFAEAPSHLTEAERLSNGRQKVDAGIWSPVDLAMDMDPDAYDDREDAQAELGKRRDETAALGLGGFSGMNFGETEQ